MRFSTELGDLLDVAAGLAMLALGAHVLARRRDRTGLAFALAIGLSGIAFALRNAIARDDPLAPAIGGEVGGALQWIAAAALVVFALAFPRPLHRRERWAAWLAGALAALWALDFILAVWGTSALPWGASLLYRAAFFAVLIAALRYPTSEPSERRVLAAWSFALAITLSLTVGAGLLGTLVIGPTLGTGFWSMCVATLAWILASRVADPTDRWTALVVALAIPALMLLGLGVRSVFPDLAAVDASGLFAGGRAAMVALLAFLVVPSLTREGSELDARADAAY